MNFLNIILASTLLLKISFSFSQEQPCTFCSYPPLMERYEIPDFFPQSLIFRQKIKKVIAFSQSGYPEKYISISSIENPYLYREYEFDQMGAIEAKIFYFEGQPYLKSVFIRNNSGNILKETRIRLDPSIEYDSYMPKEIIVDYIYDDSNNLIQKKNRNYEGEIVADEEAEFDLYEYDASNRLIKEIQIDNRFELNKTYFLFREFSDFKEDKPLKYSFGNRPPLGGQYFYNTKNQIIKNLYNDSDESDPFSYKIYYKYDNSGRLVSLERQSSDKEIFDCPEKGNFIDYFEYDDFGLLKLIKHTYKDVECYMVFEYVR